MRQPPTALPQMPADDEIDLGDLAAALGRRWPWWLSMTILGLLVGGGSSVWQRHHPNYIASALIDVSQGPGLRQNWSQAKQNRVDLLRTTQPVGTKLNNELEPIQHNSAAGAQQALQQLIDSSEAPQLELKVAPAKAGKETVPDQLLVTSSATSPPRANQSLDALLQAYQRQEKAAIAAKANPELIPIPARAAWIQPRELDIPPTHPARNLALGLVGGLVIGAATALLRDRQAGREFSRRAIQQRLGLPLWLDLPPGNAMDSFPPEAPQPLVSLMQPELHWLVVDVAKPHPQTSALASNLGIERGPILLKDALKAPTGKEIGLLVVSEAGFNSPEALDRAGNYLRQLGPAQAALVLFNVPAPRELQ